MQDRLDAMSRRVMRHADGIQLESALPRVGLGVWRQASTPIAAQYHPMVCVILQGAKQVMIGDRVLRYDHASYFVASLELPAAGRILEASVERPFVAAALTLDLDTLAALASDVPPVPEATPSGFAMAPMTPEMLEAWDHLLALLDTPADIAVLSPLRERELLYRLLQGPQGGTLRQMAWTDSRLSRVRRAVWWIQAHFSEPLRVETLAAIAGMSVPSFHRHFKAATAMSPIQFQKVVRLQAARRLLAISGEASRAAYSVGYESASQFSRDYARLFGAPPSRDGDALGRTPPRTAGAGPAPRLCAKETLGCP